MNLRLRGAGFECAKEINIKFIKGQDKIYKSYFSMFLSLFQKEEDLFGLLNLCLMKELSAKLEDEQIEKLPELLSHIMKLLKKGYSYSPISKELIVELLKRIKGSNILNFSNYLDTIVDDEQKQLLLQYLDKNDLEYIQDIKERLSNYNEYMKLFEKDFEERKRNSVFEFSIGCNGKRRFSKF